jgi:hypothetical protein
MIVGIVASQSLQANLDGAQSQVFEHAYDFEPANRVLGDLSVGPIQ